MLTGASNANTVTAQRPRRLPEAQILARYSALGETPSALEAQLAELAQNESGRERVPLAQVVRTGRFFTAQEMALLNDQDFPVAAISGLQGEGAIALRPDNGGLPVMPGATSPASWKRDRMKRGIVSRDKLLTSKIEVLRFLNYHNTRPDCSLVVHGYHTETYTTLDANGRPVVQTRVVTDFRYKVDLTDFIYPFGKAAPTSARHGSAEEMIESFLADKNRLRSLQMKKEVLWDFRTLTRLVRAYIRRLGWNCSLDVSVAFKSKSVRIAADSKLARTWDSRLGSRVPDSLCFRG